MAEATTYAPYDPAFKADPYPFYAHLRAEQPIHRGTLPGGRAVWLVTRYDDVMMVLHDPRFVKSPGRAMTPEQRQAMPQMTPALKLMNEGLLSQDPPNHTRLRALVSKAFTPRLVERLRPRIQSLADTLLDAMAGKGSADLVDEYAFPIPITVIAELLGVPLKDRDRFRAWSDAFISAAPTAESVQRLAEEVEQYVAYLQALFEERRHEPRDDLMSALVNVEEAGDHLTPGERVSMASIILIAGHETTVNLIGTGTLVLLQHPEQLARLRADPELIRPAVEEILRHSGPVEGSTERYAAQDVEIAGATIPQGSLVIVALASANRDAARFEDADALDLTRDARQHLAFGHGIHYCLGAPLARLEGQIAIGTLVQRFPELRLAAPIESLRWRPGMVVRGLEHLPVAF
jgi:cytochrome P450 PksS